MTLTTAPNKPIRVALGLGRSIVKSGERWTQEAEEAHQEALRELHRLECIIAWYWRNHGPYPTDVDAPKNEASSG